MIRKRAGSKASEAGLTDFYPASVSSKTVVYKGLALPERLDAFYLDLREEETRSHPRPAAPRHTSQCASDSRGAA